METDRSPLKILTLDGGGLQALTTLSVLGEICKAIAIQNKATRIPAPYELFDMMCGIGTGGWLALLLGRYKLDVPSCTAVYMEMAAAIDPQMASPPSRPRNKAYRLDSEVLIAKIKQVLRRYNSNEKLLDEDIDENMRCKHVFAAGPVQGSKGVGQQYRLFRTYRLRHSGSQSFRPGPDPGTCEVWKACAATGAAKYFLAPYQIEGTTFFDDGSLPSHPISSLAFDEARNIFGDQVPISVIVNIGPGIPPDSDMKKLTRQFSWPTGRKWLHWSGRGKTDTLKKMSSQSSKEALGLQQSFEKGIKDKLRQAYGPAGDEVYFHLGPEYVESRLYLNDVWAIDASSKNTDKVLEISKDAIGNVAKLIPCRL